MNITEIHYDSGSMEIKNTLRLRQHGDLQMKSTNVDASDENGLKNKM